MLVTVEGFGRIWEQRIGKSPTDPLRFSAHSAFYNTTGVPVGDTGIIKHRWKLGGTIRFQGASAFDSARIENNLWRVFECDEPERRLTWFQICCKRRLASPQEPDWFLFRVTSEQVGWINFKSGAATSADDTFLLSYSAERQEQEALLLMKARSWVQGRQGRFVVEADPRRPWRARLKFTKL